MFEKIKNFLGIKNLDEKLKLLDDLKKSIETNKAEALSAAQEYIPLMSKLEYNLKIINEQNSLVKSETDKLEGIFIGERIKNKLEIVKSEYFQKIGNIKKSNDRLKSKLIHLNNNKEIKQAISRLEEINPLQREFDVIKSNFDKGLLSRELFIKVSVNYFKKSKYIHREGGSGNYKYFYDDSTIKDFSISNNIKKIREFLKEQGAERIYTSKSGQSSYYELKGKYIRVSDHENQSDLHARVDINAFADDEQSYKDVINKIKRDVLNEREPLIVEIINGTEVEFSESEEGDIKIHSIDGKRDFISEDEDEAIKYLQNRQDDNFRAKLLKKYFGHELGDRLAKTSASKKYLQLGKIQLRIADHSAKGKYQTENEVSIVTHRNDPTTDKFTDSKNISVAGKTLDEAEEIIKKEVKKEFIKFSNNYEVDSVTTLEDYIETLDKVSLEVVKTPEKEMMEFLKNKLKNSEFDISDKNKVDYVLEKYRREFSNTPPPFEVKFKEKEIEKEKSEGLKIEDIKIGETYKHYNNYHKKDEFLKIIEIKSGKAVYVAENGHEYKIEPKYLSKINEVIEKSEQPTEAQKEVGNYKKEKLQVRGLTVSIENKRGSERSGTNKEGKEWSVTMKNDYGYFNRTMGKDGDQVDVFLSKAPEKGNIYIIDQLNEKGGFDEHKVMMGFKSEEEALKSYKSNYEKNYIPKYKAITEITEEELKSWLGTESGGKEKKTTPFFIITKAFVNGLISKELFEKAVSRKGLVPKKVLVTRNGKTFMQTVWVDPSGDVKDIDKKKEKSSDETIKGVSDIEIGKTYKVELTGKYAGIHKVVIGGTSYEAKTKRFFIRVDFDPSVTSAPAWLLMSAFKEIKAEKEGVVEKKEVHETIFPTKLSDTHEIGVLGGSSEVTIRSFGDNKFVVKKERDKRKAGQLEEEVLVDSIYKELGFGASNSKLMKEGDTLYKVSEYIEGAKTLGTLNALQQKSFIKEAQKGYVLDALLANWDVFGAGGDNMLFKEGKVYRIDNGGALRYRAKGELKGVKFSDTVGELTTLKDNIFIYKDISDEQIQEQIKEVLSKETKILSLIKDSETKSILEKRFNDLRSKLKTTDSKSEKKSKPKAKEKLKAGMPSLQTQDYLENKLRNLDFKGNPGILDAVEKQIIEIESKFRERYKNLAEELGMTVGDLKMDLQNKVERLLNKSQGFIAVNAGSNNILDLVFKDGRFKSQFETNTSKGSLAQEYRSRVENTYFGFVNSKTENKEKRPIYGYFTDNKQGVINDSGTIPPSNNVCMYGDVYLRVKTEKFLSSATVTFSDSLGGERGMSAVPAAAPHFTLLGAVSMDKYKSLNAAVSGTVSSGLNGGEYVETQYHNQLTLDDIESINIPFSKKGGRGYTDTETTINNILETFAKYGKHKSIKFIT